MTSSAAEGQGTPCSSTRWKYGVHISFNGQEIKNRLIGYFKHAFHKRGIKTTIDDLENTRGEEISQATVKAIQESRSSIIVFCPKFAFNPRCLDELVTILDCKVTYGQIVQPLFFHIEPTIVRNRQECYGKAIAEHLEKFKNEMKVKKWGLALHDAASLAGRTFMSGCESQLIQEVVQDISTNIHVPSCNADCLAGLQSYITEPQTLFGLGSCEDVDTVRENGIEGIGNGYGTQHDMTSTHLRGWRLTYSKSAECNAACQNFPNVGPGKPFFTSSSRKEADNGERFFRVQRPSTSTGSAHKDMDNLLCPKMTGIMPDNDLLNVLYCEGNGTKRRKCMAQFNVEPNARQKQTWAEGEIEFLRLLDSTSRARQVSTPRGIEDGLISTELKGNNFDSLNDFASLSAEKPSVSAVQDAGSVAVRTNEELKSAMQTLQAFVSKRFCELIPEGSKFMEHIQNNVLSFRADEKISGEMAVVLEKIRLSFTRWSQYYEEANNTLETTNVDLSKSDQLQKDFKAAVIESRLAVSAEEEHCILLDHLQCRKRVLEEELKAVEVEMKARISSLQTAAERKCLLLDKGTTLKTEKDNWEVRLLGIKGEHAAAKFTQENIEAEWSELAKMFNETYTFEFGVRGERTVALTLPLSVHAELKALTAISNKARSSG